MVGKCVHFDILNKYFSKISKAHFSNFQPNPLKSEPNYSEDPLKFSKNIPNIKMYKNGEGKCLAPKTKS